MELPPWHFGLWAGAAINDTSQVLAVGTAYGTAAVAVATIVKLTRNALMAPIVIMIGILRTRSGHVVSWSQAMIKSVPLFVSGFLIVAGMNTLGLVPVQAKSFLQDVSRLLLLAALVAIGMLPKVADMRGVGFDPFLVGFGASVGLAATTLLITILTRGVWIRVLATF